LVEHLLSEGRYLEHGHGKLICTTIISRSKQYIRAQEPSYTTVLSWYKDAAARPGLNPADYRTHSAQRGGADARG
jgi:hypothetical protein